MLRPLPKGGGLFVRLEPAYLLRMSWTIQNLIDQHRTLHAYCDEEACRHNMPIDLEWLRDRIGPDHSAYRDHLLPKFRCRECGSKRVRLIYGVDTSKVTGMWDPAANAYQKARDGR